MIFPSGINVYLFVRSFVRSFVHSFTHSFFLIFVTSITVVALVADYPWAEHARCAHGATDSL